MNIEKQEDETWTATCERSGCGSFTTRNHPTKKAAEQRLKEHYEEHDSALEAEHAALIEEGA